MTEEELRVLALKNSEVIDGLRRIAEHIKEMNDLMGELSELEKDILDQLHRSGDELIAHAYIPTRA